MTKSIELALQHMAKAMRIACERVPGASFSGVAHDDLRVWASQCDEAAEAITRLLTSAEAEGAWLRPIIAAFNADHGYAWSWFCNIAMLMQDEGVDHRRANERAARFMWRTFDFDVKKLPMWKVKPSNNMAPPPMASTVADSIEPGALDEIRKLAIDGFGMVVPYSNDPIAMANDAICVAKFKFQIILDILDSLKVDKNDPRQPGPTRHFARD